MGQFGPVPKRDSERIRRNKIEPAEVVAVIGSVEVPPLGLSDPHPIVVDLYRSLAESAQSRFYEASDWQFARFAMHFADQLLKAQRASGPVLATVHSMLGELLVSEGARRRVRMEVERSNGGTADVVDIASMFKARLAEG
jgi:hypothetical protein